MTPDRVPGDAFTVRDYNALERVMQGFLGDRKVARAAEDGSVLYGIARHLVVSPGNYGFVGPDVDVRDAYLRVTGKMGEEWAWPVRDLMDEALEGRFAAHDW